MKKDKFIDKYCKGKGLEIGGADNYVEEVDSHKIDIVSDYLNKDYTVDHVADGHDLQIFEDDKFDFLITIHVLEHLTNPIKALLEWNRVVKDGGYIFTAIPKRERTFDIYREKTHLVHLLDDFRCDVGLFDTTHIIEFNQFSVPAILLSWKHKLVPTQKIVEYIARFYRGERRFLDLETVYKLWRHLESEKIRHLIQARNRIPLDLHHHVWDSVDDIKRLLKVVGLGLVEIVDDYLGNGFLFVTKTIKNNNNFDQRINDLKNGNYPSWVGK